MVSAALRRDTPQAHFADRPSASERRTEVVRLSRASASAVAVCWRSLPPLSRGHSCAVGLRGGTAMTLVRREFLQLAAGAPAPPALAPDASPQGYPTRPARPILGLPPGGSTDSVARTQSARL